MHPAFIGAQYPFSVTSGPHPPMAATAVTFPGVPVPSMTQIAVHPYHTAEAGLPLSTTVAGEERKEDVRGNKFVKELIQNSLRLCYRMLCYRFFLWLLNANTS